MTSGEAGDVTTEWTTIALPQLLRHHNPHDIINADESGLFYKLLHNKSLVLKGDSCHGEKRSKEQLTILPCANMTGAEQLPILVIGKAGKPRCFKDVKSPPTPYCNKKSGCGNKIVIVIDNCPAHPHIDGL